MVNNATEGRGGRDRMVSGGTPASSTNKTGRHDIAEVLLKVALNTKNLNKKSALWRF
jgi:hypothetical protein